MSQFRDEYDEFRRHGVEVAACSVDSPYSHRVWTRELSVPFPMISDFDREIMRRYAIPDGNMRLLPNVTNRTAFLIDSTKRVRYAWYRSQPGEGIPMAEILEAARSLPGELSGS